MISKTVYHQELIGKEIEVIDSKNKSNLGIKGKIIDETKSTLKILCPEGTKILIKSNIKFKLKETGLVLEGKDMIKRPEERLKEK